MRAEIVRGDTVRMTLEEDDFGATLRLVVLLSAFCACTPQSTPVTPTPDASDASAFGEASPQPPVAAACASACAALTAAKCGVGGAQGCPAFMQTLSNSGQQANPATGKALTCADVMAVKTAADAQKLGFVCSP
jgi:hypothetical protein